MSDEADALDGAIMGGLAAREIDRAISVPRAHDLTVCQNCGAHLRGPYCHQCGQSGHVHRTIGHVFEEFAHGVLHVDGKLWRTIPMLAFNPGRLTREYVHGKRVRYIAPLALYLFTVLLTFLVFGFAGGSVIGASDPPNVAEARAMVQSAEAELRLQRSEPDTTASEKAALQTAVNVARANLASAERAVAEGRTRSWTEKIADAQRRGDMKINVGDTSMNDKIAHALSEPEFFLYKIEQKAYKLSFLLVPLSLPFVWLLFARRSGVTLYDHSVFILYSVSFMLLFVCAMVLLSAVTAGATDGLIGPAFALIPAAHVFAQLKGAYRLTGRGALWRTALMLVAVVLVLLLYIFLLLLAFGFTA